MGQSNPSVPPRSAKELGRYPDLAHIAPVTRRALPTHDSCGNELAALDWSHIDADRDWKYHAVGVRSDRALLGFENGLVLVKGAHDALADHLVERAVIQAELAHDAPEIMRGSRSLRGNQ